MTYITILLASDSIRRMSWFVEKSLCVRMYRTIGYIRSGGEKEEREKSSEAMAWYKSTRICSMWKYRASLFELIKQPCMQTTTSIIQAHFSPIHSAQYTTCGRGSTYLYITVAALWTWECGISRKKKQKKPRRSSQVGLRDSGKKKDKNSVVHVVSKSCSSSH